MSKGGLIGWKLLSCQVAFFNNIFLNAETPETAQLHSGWTLSSDTAHCKLFLAAVNGESLDPEEMVNNPLLQLKYRLFTIKLLLC